MDGAVFVLVKWVELGLYGRTWEPLDRIHSSAPNFVRSELTTFALHKRFVRGYVQILVLICQALHVLGPYGLKFLLLSLSPMSL